MATPELDSAVLFASGALGLLRLARRRRGEEVEMMFSMPSKPRGLIGCTLALALLLVYAITPAAFAQAAAHCQLGQSPDFVFGFADLKSQLGDAMGDPVSCEYADPNGTGDTLQDTSKGLAFWRKSTNTPTFTDGGTHWALAASGLVSWTGASIDPPPFATAPPSPPPPPPPPSTPPPPPPSTNTCGATSNPWGYTFCGGSVIASPPANFCSVFACIASFWNQTNGYVVQCMDGLFSHSGGVRGSCSSHGGNGRTLYASG
jgi:hypothetical protein